MPQAKFCFSYNYKSKKKQKNSHKFLAKECKVY